MAAPEYVPVKSTDRPRAYESPDHVPDPWVADRPGDFDGPQPEGKYHGDPGPDQGYALVLAKRFHDRLHLGEHEHAEDAIAGCVGVATRRASLFRRAPVIHDLEIAFTVWGFLDPAPPRQLVELRQPLFQSVSLSIHYLEQRTIAAQVPEETLRMRPEEVRAAYPARWSALIGLVAANQP
ncbi:MAG TPA: hypothetical protein VK461_00360, partial [Acidimicrobiales bacterium]|nr:hypothetical protein [Acidimicrobiales bacterium]